MRDFIIKAVDGHVLIITGEEIELVGGQLTIIGDTGRVVAAFPSWTFAYEAEQGSERVAIE